MIINFSSNDYANFGHENANALRSIGVECRDYTLNSHLFKYSSQSEKIKSYRIPELCKGNIVQVMHGCPHLLDLVKKSNPKKIIVYQTGTRYRNEPDKFNELFKGIQSITDQTEFMSLGEHDYLVSPVNYPFVEKYDTKKKIVIAHYPSNVEIKGTSDIIRMINSVRHNFDVRIDTKKVTHRNQIERMAACDIYVELFKPEINGKPYGCFGVTALEAAAMGKIVITNNLNLKVYTDVYRLNPFFIANTEADFKQILLQLSLKSREEIIQLQKYVRSIILMNHSYEATGNRILKLIK